MSKQQKSDDRAPKRGLPRDEAAAVSVRLRRAEATRLRTVRILHRIQASSLYRFQQYLRERTAMTELRAAALLLSPMGLAALFRCLILPLLTDDFPLLLADGICGIVLLILSLALAPFRAPIARALNEDRLLSRFLFNTLGLRRPYLSKHRPLSGWLILFAGLLLSVAALFYSPLVIGLLLLTLLLACLSLISPEFSLILTGIFFPLTPLSSYGTKVLSFFLLLTLFSYLLKLISGKRRIFLELGDLFVLLFVTVLVLSSLISGIGLHKGASAWVFDAVLTVCGYFLAANLLLTRRTILLFSNGLLFAATLLGAFGVFLRCVSLFAPTLAEGEAVSLLLDGFRLLFPSDGSFLSYLLLLFPLALSLLLEGGKLRPRYLPTLFILAVGLSLSLSLTAYLSLSLSLLLFRLLASRRVPRWFLPLFLILPSLLLFLPRKTWEALASALAFSGIGESLSSLHDVFHRALALLGEYPFGLNADALPLPLLLGAENAKNLYLQIALLIGLPALAFFLLLLVYSLRSLLPVCLYGRENRYRLITVGGVVGIFAMLFPEFANYSLESPIIMFLFFLFLGLLMAVRRAAREEEGLALSRPTETETAATSVRLARRGYRGGR